MILTTLLMALFGTPDFPNHLGTGIEAQPAAIDPAQTCELHVFPTQEIIDSSPDYESPFGTPLLVGAAIAALQHTGSGRAKAGALKEMKILFEPRIQIEELQRANLLAALKLPQNTQVIQEAALPALWGSTPEESEPKSAYKRYWTAMKTGTALVASSSRCYREIYVASISISKGLGSLQFASSFVYRVFDEQYRETKAFDGGQAVPLTKYLSLKTQPSASDLDVAFKAAFADDFSQWVSRRVKL